MISHYIQVMEGKKKISQDHSDCKDVHLLQPPGRSRINTQTMLLRVLSSWVLKTSKDRVYAASLGNLHHCFIVLIVKNVFLV